MAKEGDINTDEGSEMGLDVSTSDTVVGAAG